MMRDKRERNCVGWYRTVVFFLLVVVVSVFPVAGNEQPAQDNALFAAHDVASGDVAGADSSSALQSDIGERLRQGVGLDEPLDNTSGGSGDAKFFGNSFDERRKAADETSEVLASKDDQARKGWAESMDRSFPMDPDVRDFFANDTQLTHLPDSMVDTNATSVHDNSTSDVMNNSTSDVMNNSTSDVMNNSTSDAMNNSTSDVMNNSTSDVMNNSTSDVMNNSTSDVMNNSTSHINSANDSTSNSTGDSISNSTTDVIVNSTADSISNSTSDISNSTSDVTTNSTNDMISINATGDSISNSTSDSIGNFTSDATSNSTSEMFNSTSDVASNSSEADTTRCQCAGSPCVTIPAASCAWNRTVLRPDCPCCSQPVCARQIGQSCNHDLLACDRQLGLHCDNDTNLCSGPFGLMTADTTHNSSVLRWRSVQSDTDISSLRLLISQQLTSDDATWIPLNNSLDRGTTRVDDLHPGTLYYVKLIDDKNNSEIVILKTKDGCSENGSSSYEVGEQVQVGCELTCLCVANNETACSVRICPSTRPAAADHDATCREVPDPADSCCTIWSCPQQRDGHSLSAGEPQVIATGRSPVSLTIAWDDFKVPGPNFDHGYVVEYRPRLNDTPDVAHPWNVQQVEDGPFTTIRNLTPNTAYEVRVSIPDESMHNDDEDIGIIGGGGGADSARPSTGITVLSTADGCVWNGRPLAPGDKYERPNCTARCTCLGDDQSECGPRCLDPYHPRGNLSAADSGCHEVDLDDDPCCVILACPSRTPPLLLDTTTTTTLTTTQKVGSSGLALGECPLRIRDESGWCQSNCSSNADCSSERKCCLTECGSTVCAKPIITGAVVAAVKPAVVEAGRNPCERNVCGPNAMCKQYEQTGLCHCLPGFSGDPYEGRRGCQPVFQLSARTKSKAGCTFGNATYQVGETFYNGCEYKCQCINNKGKFEMSCQPRCQLKEEKMRSRDPSCHLRSDPDDDCCKLLVCETLENDAEEREGSTTKNLSRLPAAIQDDNNDDGCLFKGTKYARDERFFDGCRASCYCAGRGEVLCDPRCPIIQFSPDHGCKLVTSPIDDCCKVVSCGPSFSDMLDLDQMTNVSTNPSANSSSNNFTIDQTTIESSTDIETGNNDTELSSPDQWTNSTSPLNTTTEDSSTGESSTLMLDTDSTDNSTTTDENDGFNSTSDGLASAASSERNVTVAATNITVTDDVAASTNETMARHNNRPLFNESGSFLDALDEDSSTANATSDDELDSFAANNTTTDETMSNVTMNDRNSTRDNGTAPWSFRAAASSESDGSTGSTSSNEVTSAAPKGEPRLLKDTVFRGRLANIYRVIVINPTMVRLQLVLAPSIMERMFMESGEGVLLLYTANLTHTDVADWQRHPLALEHVGFVSVDRSDVAVEIIVSELQPGSQYNFVVAMPREGSDPDAGLQYELLSEVAATVTIKLEGMCAFMGKSMPIGDRMYEECQTVCDCLPGLVVHCEAIMCPNQLSPEKSGCLEWNIDKSFIPRPTHCCPDASCKYGSVCTFKGQKFRNLERIPQSLVDECDQECKCVAGNISCSPRCAATPLQPPADPDCLEPELQLIPGDQCCRHWHCKRTAVEANETVTTEGGQLLSPETVTTLNTTANENVTSTLLSTDLLNELMNVTSTEVAAETPPTTTAVPIECVYENATYRLNEQWRVGKGHRQKLCSCLLLHNGAAAAECQGGCPPILKQHKDLVTDCPPENVVVLDVPDLCPYVVCNKTDTGRGVKNVSVEPLNATAIRITFIIPSIYVGLYGHIEILYTMDLTHSEDTTTWNKEVFSGPSNQFENARLTHEMTGLQPDTEYFVKVLVIIKNTKNMDSSETLTIRMPPLPTTTTTTTTTTLPPKISLDARLKVSDVQTGSAKVTWRTFDEWERRFIDGVQLQHKLSSEDAQRWSQSALIHRDVNFYTLDHLRADSLYDVDIVFVPPVNVSTEVLSESAVSFHTLAMHDDFEFNLTLTVDKVSSYTIELIWTGVPYPEMKYVNVYRVAYDQHSASKESTDPSEGAGQFYRQPNGKEFQVTIDQLMPDTNYTVYMEAFLSNGKVRSSNRISVTTKPGALITKTSEKEKLEASEESVTKNAGNTYYAALIVVAVIAALCALGFAILLVILLRKQSSAKAPITSSKSQSAYDNPSYKDNMA